MYPRRWQDDNEDLVQRNSANNHQAFQWPTHLERNVYYVGEDGTEQQSFRNDIIHVGQQQHNQTCYPFAYVMVNEDGLQERHHYNTYHQMTTNCLLPPPNPVPSMLPPFISSSLPESYSYFMHHPSTTITQAPQQQLLPQSLTMGNTVQHCHQRIHCNENNTSTAVEMIANDTSSSCFRPPLHLEANTIATGMTSTVTVNKTLCEQQQKPSNNDATIAETIVTNQISGKQIIMEVNDEKVISVCKRTILSAINKIIKDDYVSALYKLRKSIRILDILMFNEDGKGIGSAKVETVKPWLETLKDMEKRLSLKDIHQHKDKSDNRRDGSTVIEKAECKIYNQQPRRHSHYNNISCGNSVNRSNNRYSTDNCRSICNGRSKNNGSIHYWRSNTKRYRTTGKCIMKHCRRDHDRHRYR